MNKKIPVDGVEITVSDTPHFTDHCQHGDGTFACSLSWREHFPPQTRHVDVYFYDDTRGQNICLRDGEAGGDHRSYESLHSFLSFAVARGWRDSYVVAHALAQLGKLTWTPTT